MGSCSFPASLRSIIQRLLGPLTLEQGDLFLRNPRFLGLKCPDMTRPETIQKKYVGVLSRKALAFMKPVLQMEPLDRASARACVSHPFFEDLQPREASNGPTPGGDVIPKRKP